MSTVSARTFKLIVGARGINLVVRVNLSGGRPLLADFCLSQPAARDRMQMGGQVRAISHLIIGNSYARFSQWHLWCNGSALGLELSEAPAEPHTASVAGFVGSVD